ncbi:MAG: 50S rRNA methyltransferase [Candidatus Peregrinibacteria bacterium GW2011_GWF2_33_10]|nr:MAG: 50S rRNA methyltransferase [Candidatus Peregrinibacteria bacterium GW2011_GWF2_33_10]OGJ44811.1 MAG: hypothetical protein A2263_06260 [Candidatus Peregrinibacteria bacterium RIFOXYA2_FULL_33_21]OGJ47394.1 MAG: hypothetical protein A2272_02660 [Candidatus Peregrinibacteria bacterium RIFOXYA12_FULL_33_12]OGJ50497.1 MAG: hypothetical protein A2307_02885 [Candidatus Peregrinibacteria bacterium RIFOXYB2_FULL_33_20]
MPKAFTPNDKYFYKAKREGYMARSVFKLEEIQNKFRLIQSGDKVLDLGCAPGSWMQYILKMIGEKGSLVGLDLQKVDIQKLPLSFKRGGRGVSFECDIFDNDKITCILGNLNFNVVTSDAAPNTSGIHEVDCSKSEEICLQVLEIAKKYLRKNGSLIMKIFQGEDYGKVVNQTKEIFDRVTCFKPKACRDRSREIYIIGFRKK